jgi:hypothetical protein
MKTCFPSLWHHGLLAATALWLAGPGPVPQLEAAAPPSLMTKDKVRALEGVFRGNSNFTPDGGGRSGSAGDRAADLSPAGRGPVHIANGGFLNEASAGDEMSFAIWIKKTDTAPTANSVFWGVSPSSNNGQRGWQAHLPWSDSNIYFDTAGCCEADLRRISASIETFPFYTFDYSWWQEWHFFVFSKKADVKQIWIDGELFLEGSNTAPLPTDFTELFLGSEASGANVFNGLMDDLSIYGTALTQAQIGQLRGGTAPTALPATAELLAYWDFNDYPTSGHLVSLSPAPNATGASPDLIEVVWVQGTPAWDQNSVTLKVDGATVTPTFTLNGDRLSVRYVPNPMFAAQSTHTVALTYPLPGGGSDTYEWQFTVGAFTRDLVQSRIGVFRGGSTFTPAGAGRTGTGADRAVDFGMGTGPVYISQVDFLNQAAANDEMTFAIWAKKRDIADGSAFWGVSPSSSEGRRGWQAHLPWSNNNIYFDTAGCCDGATQRINASIETYPNYTFEVSWWYDWHFFVFSKKAEVKQIWIDGMLFLEGYNTNPLPTDFIELMLGSDGAGGGLFHGQLDDLSVYRTALTEAQIGQLFGGTSPQALPGAAGLLAYWNFDDMPAEGLFVSFTPEPNSLAADPNLIRVVHAEGTPAWDTSKVSLLLDGNAVSATVTQSGGFTTVTYVPNPLLAVGSHHTATIRYPAADGTTILSRDWEFTVGPYTKDVLHSYVGVLRGPAKFTADAGGRTGQAGDYGIDFGTVNNRQGVFIGDASWLNQASAVDQFAVAGWQKLHNVADSAFLWVVSPSSNGGQRGIGTHTPWSNNNLYFDTAGCCDAGTQRINQAITEFPGYSGDVAWWRDWHHFVFQKNAEVKQIWIDGQLFLEGYNTNPLPNDFSTAWFGYNPVDNGGLQGILDDMALYGAALTEAQVGQLAAGSSPQSLPATAKLLAYWNFNDASVPASVLSISLSGGNVTINWTNGGTLQQATSVTGPYADIAGATTGSQTVPATQQAQFFRVRQ